jgi:hypothetical protein
MPFVRCEMFHSPSQRSVLRHRPPVYACVVRMLSREKFMLRISLIVLIAAATCATAWAQEPAPPNGPSRYSFNRVNDEFLRLDTQTGQVTECRAALEKEIGRLQNEVAALKDQLAALKTPADKSSELKLKMPSKEDVARARVFIEGTWRNLVDMISTMQKDMMRKG